MKLRIIRTPYWEEEPFTMQTVVGGPRRHTLKHKDVLEYFNELFNEWEEVEIIEGDVPPRPSGYGG